MAILCVLPGAEVTPEVNVTKKKYGIKVDVPSIDGMGQFHLLCDDVSPMFSLNQPWFELIVNYVGKWICWVDGSLSVGFQRQDIGWSRLWIRIVWCEGFPDYAVKETTSRCYGMEWMKTVLLYATVLYWLRWSWYCCRTPVSEGDSC